MTLVWTTDTITYLQTRISVWCLAQKWCWSQCGNCTWQNWRWWSGNGNWATLYDCIETVDGICSVENCAQRTIRIDDRVGTLNHISIPYLLLALAVSGYGILYVVGIGVLWMWIEIRVNGHSWQQATLHGDGEESAAHEETLQRMFKLSSLQA